MRIGVIRLRDMARKYRRFLLYGMFFLFFLLLHFLFTMQTGDDVGFLKTIREISLLPLLKRRYLKWSSRLLLEACLFTLVKHEVLWRFLDSLMMLLTVWSLERIVFGRERRLLTAVECFLGFFLIPFSLYHSAGWIATTLNYIWPAACALYSMTPVRAILKGETVPWYWYASSSAALLLALNMEQSLAVMFGMDVLLTGYLFWWLPRREKGIKLRGRRWIVFRLAAGAAALAFTFTCPGNFVRKAEEVGKWFPDYDFLSLPRKLEIGYSSTLFHFVFRPNVLFCVFAVCLCCAVWMRCTRIFARAAAAIPLVLALGFGILGDVTQRVFPGVYEITQTLTNYGTLPIDKKAVFADFIPDVVLLAAALSVLAALWFAFAEKKLALLCCAVVLLGFASRMAMSFSPTIWASADRTFLFMYDSILLVFLFLLRELQNSNRAQLPATALTIGGGFGLLRELLS